MSTARVSQAASSSSASDTGLVFHQNLNGLTRRLIRQRGDVSEHFTDCLQQLKVNQAKGRINKYWNYKHGRLIE